MPRSTLIAALAANLFTLAAAAREDPPRTPAFDPALAPMVGTWKRIKQDSKEPDLLLVIKEEKGLLRLRYQLNTRKKVYSSDWNGDIEVDLWVNMKEFHKLDLTVFSDPPRIEVDDKIRYTGTWKGPKPRLLSSYEMGPEGKLLLRCRKFLQDDKEYPCPKPVEYGRVSTDTRWPD